jgi:hypothetical protein
MMKISSNFCRAIRSERRCRGRAVRSSQFGWPELPRAQLPRTFQPV